MHQVVVMGVTGAGKTTVGVALADRLGMPFLDADTLHPPENIEKMAAGIPLTDEDRGPWLDEVGSVLAAAGADGTGLVVACSALTRRYRDRIRVAAPLTRFVHLTGGRALLAQRIAGRSDHFMPLSLLDSQLSLLEPLGADESGTAVRIDQPTARIVDLAAASLRD